MGLIGEESLQLEKLSIKFVLFGELIDLNLF